MKNFRLKKAPIFMKFLTNIVTLMNDNNSNEVLNLGEDIENNLFIDGYCKCKQKDCGTVYLRRLYPWPEEEQGVFDINTNKGIIFIHINTYSMEVEALEYNYYPYKVEIKNLFNTRLDKNKDKSLDSYMNRLMIMP